MLRSKCSKRTHRASAGVVGDAAIHGVDDAVYRSRAARTSKCTKRSQTGAIRAVWAELRRRQIMSSNRSSCSTALIDLLLKLVTASAGATAAAGAAGTAGEAAAVKVLLKAAASVVKSVRSTLPS